jgi:hypothetical protein
MPPELDVLSLVKIPLKTSVNNTSDKFKLRIYNALYSKDSQR